MLPTFQSGARVFVYRWGAIRKGDIVVFQKNGRLLIKRAVQKVGDRWCLRGDNLKESIEYDNIDRDAIKGRVLFSY